MVLGVWKDVCGQNGTTHHSCADHGEAAPGESANVSENAGADGGTELAYDGDDCYVIVVHAELRCEEGGVEVLAAMGGGVEA